MLAVDVASLLTFCLGVRAAVPASGCSGVDPGVTATRCPPLSRVTVSPVAGTFDSGRVAPVVLATRDEAALSLRATVNM